jgi:polyphosphate kinase
MTTKRQTSTASYTVSSDTKAPATRASSPRAVKSPPGGRFINRDESWMLFNRRVLEEAEDPTNPLMERVKFLAITASNLDEFVEIRVAGILQRLEEGLGLPQSADEGGYTRDERMDRLRERMHEFATEQADCWNRRLVPALSAAGIRIVQWKQLREADRTFASKFFREQVDPLLTPVTLDPSHPFPRVLNKALCLALLLRHKRKTKSGSNPKVLGVVTIPRSIPSLIALPPDDKKPNARRGFLLLEDLIGAHIEGMFRGYSILDRATFRVTRNSNLYMQEEESRSVLESVAEELHNRRKGDAVRLEIEASASPEIIDRAGQPLPHVFAVQRNQAGQPEVSGVPWTPSAAGLRQGGQDRKVPQHLCRAAQGRHSAAPSL